MLNFPVPYPDELVYSVVARAGVHAGITGPLRTFAEVFHGQKAVATVDLPSYLQIISEHYPKSLGVTAEALAYKHTLFPLYAPFVPETRRLKCLDRMKHRAKGTVHRALGVAVSLIQQKQHFRICPECMIDQLSKYGEYYWARTWQAPGCRYCLDHAELSRTDQPLHNDNLFTYSALAPNVTYSPPESNSPFPDKRIEKRAKELLGLPPMLSPSFDQWHRFYRQLAHDADLSRRSVILHENFKAKVLSTWSSRKLLELGIPITDRQTNWLRRFMRKTPRAYSYLQHVVVLESLLGPRWHFKEVIAQAQRQTIVKSVPLYSSSCDIPKATLYAKKKAWLEMVKPKGTSEARRSGGADLYRWLYKHDRNWLLQVNNKYRKKARPREQVLDWYQRDKQVLKRLEAVKQKYAGDMDTPRQSARWYLAQVDCRRMASVLNRLPLSASFLEAHSEDVPSYQIRRIIRALKAHEHSVTKLSYNKLLQLSGLSNKTMKTRTRQFLRTQGWPA